MTGDGVTAPMRRWLIVSDIDDTLTGDALALADLIAQIDMQGDRLFLALNSSRPYPSVARTLRTAFPPAFRPGAVITALGTEIRIGDHLCSEWTQRLAGWPAAEIHARLTAAGHRPHAPEYQTALKVSFAVPAAAQPGVRADLAAAGLPCRIIASGADDFDIIPPAAGKDAASLFLAARLGLDRDNLVVAGDSGNDLAMFGIASCAIAVGNARAELLSAMPAATSWHAPRPHAAGVLDGLVHFGVLPRPGDDR